MDQVLGFTAGKWQIIPLYVQRLLNKCCWAQFCIYQNEMIPQKQVLLPCCKSNVLDKNAAKPTKNPYIAAPPVFRWDILYFHPALSWTILKTKSIFAWGGTLYSWDGVFFSFFFLRWHFVSWDGEFCLDGDVLAVLFIIFYLLLQMVAASSGSYPSFQRMLALLICLGCTNKVQGHSLFVGALQLWTCTKPKGFSRYCTKIGTNSQLNLWD